MNQPLLIINNLYRIAFERNKLREKEDKENKQPDGNNANISEAMSELSNAIEEGVI